MNNPSSAAGKLPGAPLEAVLRTEELANRPARPPDYAAENRALVALAQALANSPATIMQAVAEAILVICGCGSAAVSLLAADETRFYWPALAGAWQPYTGGGTPRDFGPCGDVLDRNRPLLFAHPERRYPNFHKVLPLAAEALLVPIHAAGQAVGTIWAVAHDGPARPFDNEDLRLLESLGQFTSAAYWALEALAQSEHQGKTLWEVRQVNEALLVSSLRQHELAEQGQVALAASENTLRRRNTQLSAFLETSAIGLHRVGGEGEILWANEAELDMLGYASDDYVGHNIAEFHVDQPRITDILRRLRRGERLHEYEAQLRRCDGSIITVLIDSSALFEDGQFVHTQCFTRDITARKQAEVDLQVAHDQAQHTADRLARLQKVTAALSEAVTPAQVAEVIVEQGAPALGAVRGTVLLLAADGQTLEMLRSAAPASAVRPYQQVALTLKMPVTDAVRTGQPIWIESRPQYLKLYPHLSEQIAAWGHQAAAALPIMDQARRLGVLALSFSQAAAFSPEDQAYALTLARLCAQALERARLYEEEQQARATLEARVQARTAELEQSSAQLRDLSARLQSAREEERTRVSRDIHDELGSALTALKMDIARVQRHTTDGEPLGDLRPLMNAVDNILRMTRQLATELRPSLLDHFGLAAAMEWQVQDFEKRAGVRTHFATEGAETSLDPEIATAVFRVFQETLTNVARHAQASKVDVRLKVDQDRLVLEVRDNGRGINTSTLTNQKSLGLVGMRERVRLLSGEINIEGRVGHGTTVRIKVPLPARPAN